MGRAQGGAAGAGMTARRAVEAQGAAASEAAGCVAQRGCMKCGRAGQGRAAPGGGSTHLPCGGGLKGAGSLLCRLSAGRLLLATGGPAGYRLVGTASAAGCRLDRRQAGGGCTGAYSGGDVDCGGRRDMARPPAWTERARGTGTAAARQNARKTSSSGRGVLGMGHNKRPRNHHAGLPITTLELEPYSVNAPS